MSRWQIASIHLYSHDGRRLDIKFELSAVNILVGVSYAGKSSLVEVIDYCLGARECHIPGVVREATSWVGIAWKLGKSQLFICRRVPAAHRQSSDEVFVARGAPVQVPESSADLRPNTNRDGSLRVFEQALGIGAVVGETFTDRDGTRISLRQAVPYLLQSDDVIVNKTALLRGANDERRLGVADSIPYFLGAVDEETARAEAMLRQLRTQRDRESKRVDGAKRLLDQVSDRSMALLTEAAQLGMVEAVSHDLSPQAILATLQGLARWTAAAGSAIEEDQLQSLYRTERELRQSFAALRQRIEAADSAVESAMGFTDAALSQRRRLDVLGLYRRGVERDTCPVCDATFDERTSTLSAIEDAIRRLDDELADVGRDRPKIDKYVRDLSEELADVARQLEGVRARIAAVIAESEETTDRLNLDNRRLRVAGRVSYYLEERDVAAVEVDRTALDQIEAQIRGLEEIADPQAKADRVEAIQSQVSIHATDIFRKLPFDINYKDCQVAFNLRQLSIRFVLGARVMQMRDVGGDESYLSGHVATLLALHRVFGDSDRPVPGLIVFDQLSRPFFPADEHHGEVEVTGADRRDLKAYFDVLFEEVETRSSLQVIVLEHAYFADDPRYVAAVRRRWTDNEKLIPADWPRLR
jgi:regulator of replication initiation timing